MNDQLTPKEARILLVMLENKATFEALREAVICIYGRESDRKVTWPRAIKRKIKKLYESQFK